MRKSRQPYAAYFLTYVAILLAMAVMLEVNNSVVDETSQEVFKTIVLLAGLFCGLGLLVKMFVSRWRGFSTEVIGNSKSDVSGGVQLRSNRSHKRQWLVTVICALVLSFMWSVMVQIVREIGGSEITSMMLVQSPLVTAIVTTISIGFLGPLRYPRQSPLAVFDWLPLATVMMIAILGTVLVPWIIVRTSDAQMDLWAMRGELHLSFLFMPGIASVIRIFLVAR